MLARTVAKIYTFLVLMLLLDKSTIQNTATRPAYSNLNPAQHKLTMFYMN